MSRKSETRDVSGFSIVEVQGGGDLFVEQNPGGDGPESLWVEADEEILGRLKSEVRGDRLILGWDMPWWEWITWWLQWISLPDRSIRYAVKMNQVRGLGAKGAGDITCPSISTDTCRLSISGSGKIRVEQLEAVESLDTRISGSGTIRVSGVTTKAARASISGAGTIELAGVADRLDANISGSGSIWTAGLETQQTSITISGSGRARVNASEELDVQISGSGDVDYAGHPRVSQSISGSGRVREFK